MQLVQNALPGLLIKSGHHGTRNMFLNRFRNKLLSTPSLQSNDEQALIITVFFEGMDDFGAKTQQSEIHNLEKEIERLLPEDAELDGDEFGDGECIIYIYGPSADTLFSSVRNALQKSAFNRMEIKLRYGRPEDPSAAEKTFSL